MVHRRTWVLALAAVASLMTALDALVVSASLTTIQADLGATAEQLEWTVNSYNLVMAVLLMPAAALGDRYGRRRMFAAGIALFTAASAACAAAPDVVVLVLARAVQGAGAAFVSALAMTLVSAAFPPERRGGAIGLLQGGSGIAVLAGPGIGGAITHAVGWEFVFWLNVPIGLAVLPLILAKCDESRGAGTALDVRGLLLVIGAVLGLVWALARGNAVGWVSTEVLGALALGGAALVAFVAWERRATEPMFPMRLLRCRGFVAGNVATAGLFASIFGGLFFYAQLLQTGLGLTPLQAGIGLVPWTSTLIVLGPLSGRLADRIGNRPLIVTGLLTTAAGIAWVALVARPGMPYGELVVPFLVASIGGSMALAPTANAVLGAVPAADIGKASGVNAMLRELGGVLGLAVFVAVFTGTGSYASPAAFVDGFGPAMGTCAALVALSAAAVAVRRRPVADIGVNRVAAERAVP
ncbi:EmrB/QacA subfamily drug resistance transporter [Pseudonocardia hierapolitana]|uniref:EmrB/QacA subfamily drug resistance transporter n=1 Tax=Pseudonocardia hierapolitana TaxID=1128676 RepID=A0A561T4I2_9PSEU|nr:MFS transporter [Pseudonocardia hierapolitana]TWF82015.1 EmrB/QacA subfamily drug resistance transporter [Pseudonocardia hierapolitana]